MRKLYEIFKVLKIQKRIVSAETIRGNTYIKQFTKSAIEFSIIFNTPKHQKFCMNTQQHFLSDASSHF